jgi:DHA3 family tetracycline resistance protein-like MFS transporter
VLDRVGILRPLRIRDFRRLWIGMFVSMAGDGIYFIAIAWQVTTLSGRPSALALVGLAWTLPQVLFSLIGGVMADRFDRRRIMISGDLIRLGALGTIGFLSITGAIELGHIYPLVAAYGVGQAIFMPSFTSIVPTIVPPERLVEANSLGQFVRPISMTVIGPALGGIVIGLLSVGWAFALDAATFGFSAVMIFLIRARVARDPVAEHPSALAQVAEGLRYVRRHRWLLIAMFGATISLLCTWGPWEALVPILIRQDLRGSPGDLSLVFVAGGIGSVLSAVFFGQRSSLPRRPIVILYSSWAFAMLMTAGFGLVGAVWQAMIVAFLAESGITILVIVWLTLVQRLVPGHLLGRVMSLDWMISTAGVPVSFAIVGPVAEAIGVRATLVWAGVLGGLVTISFLFVPGAQDPERDGSLVTPPEVPEGVVEASPTPG